MNRNNQSPVHRLAVAGLIAGLYTALTVALAPLSFGLIQCRVAEALTILAVYSPTSVVGLTVGCALSNLIGLSMGANIAGALDILFGTLATGLAALLSYRLGRYRLWGLPVLSAIPPVVLNALIVGAELTLIAPVPTWEMFATEMALVGVGQLIACVGGGLILAIAVEKAGLDRFLTGTGYTNR